MERIDKLISNQSGYSRKEVKELIKKKRITINGEIILKSDIKVNPEIDVIKIDNQELKVSKNIYLVLNKPTGYISATVDKTTQTVLDLVPSIYLHRNLFPAGRLDKDTTGLMIITDDGTFAHEMAEGFKDGIKLNDGECKSATLEITGDYTAIVTITEGRYHQIKRMFGCYNAKVTKLQRIAIGNLKLPDNLKLGECRELTEDELKQIKELN